MEIVENLLRKAYGETLNYGKDIFCRYTLESMRRIQFQCVSTKYVIENKEFTLKTSNMSIVFASFKHLKLPITIIIPVTVQQIVYVWYCEVRVSLQPYILFVSTVKSFSRRSTQSILLQFLPPLSISTPLSSIISKLDHPPLTSTNCK